MANAEYRNGQGITKLLRDYGGQRGHVKRLVFLIELRCVLWASPPSITAFGLPALQCQSVFCKCRSVRCGADMAPARPSHRVRISCGARPLRPPAALLYNAALPLNSQLVATLKLRLDSRSPLRALSGEGNRRCAK